VQGFASPSAPTKAEKAVPRTLRHDGTPCYADRRQRRQETDAAGNLKLSKKASTERIDGAAALVMAVDRMDRNAAPVAPDHQFFVLRPR
jgi:phage terminase large subunit-like protein